MIPLKNFRVIKSSNTKMSTPMRKTDKNICWDIDATLAHTHGDIDNFDMLKIYSKPQQIKLRRNLYRMTLYDVAVEDGTGDAIELVGIFRPYLKECLDFCFEYFNHVIFWSAGKKKYVEKMVDLMCPLSHKRPTIIYTYDDCDVGKEDYLKKPLKKLYNDLRLAGLGINETNTFVVDDRDDTFSLNKNNGIQIPEFESDMTAEEIKYHPDNNLLKLMCWFEQEEVRNCKDVRDLDKKKIFKTSLKEYKSTLKKSRKK